LSLRWAEFENASEFDMSITTEVEHHDFDEPEDTFVQESNKDVVRIGPTNLELMIIFFYGIRIFFMWVI